MVNIGLEDRNGVFMKKVLVSAAVLLLLTFSLGFSFNHTGAVLSNRETLEVVSSDDTKVKSFSDSGGLVLAVAIVVCINILLVVAIFHEPTLWRHGTTW